MKKIFFVPVRFIGIILIAVIMLPASALLGVAGTMWKLLDHILEHLTERSGNEENSEEIC